MSDLTLPAHSPLGGSGAARWIACPGSVSLAYGIQDEQDDTFSRPGTAAHTLAEMCLRTGKQPWEAIGYAWTGDDIVSSGEGYDGVVPIDKEMADAVQVYVAEVERWHPDRNQGNCWIERRFHCPEIHRFFYGTADLGYHDAPRRHLHVWDYKHGAGIVVEAPWNAQCMYYGVGLLTVLELWDAVDTVVFHIVQPRGWHLHGPHRTWSISTNDLLTWRHEILVPAMERALTSRETASGEHCRFCPVRARACPQIMRDAKELEELMQKFDEKGTARPLTNDEVARFLDLSDVIKIAIKAANDTAFQRLQSGAVIPGRKLANAKVNREWKEGAEAALVEKFKEEAYEPKKLRSPAQVEALPEGDQMAARWAFKPPAGLVVVKGDDMRPAVNKAVKSMFTDQTKKRRSK